MTLNCPFQELHAALRGDAPAREAGEGGRSGQSHRLLRLARLQLRHRTTAGGGRGTVGYVPLLKI